MEKTMRTLGMIVRAIWPDGDAPGQVFDVATTQPATARAMLATRAERISAGEPRYYDIQGLLARLPADLSDPDGGVQVEDQGPFWLGYYHYAAGIDRARNLGPEALEKIGQALYGDRWQSDIARDLGLSDARRVRQWMAGERPIPPGVWADLGALAVERKTKLEAIIDGLGDHRSDS